jgi:hypothetical protein
MMMLEKQQKRLMNMLVVIFAMNVYSPASLAQKVIAEADLTWQQHLVIDELMDTLHGPRRSTIAYRDYTALRDQPEQPPIWPLYKQQPAFAQSDFRQLPADTSLTVPQNPDTVSNPGLPGIPDQNAIPDQSDVTIIQPEPISLDPPAVDIIEPDPVDSPVVDLPGDTVPGPTEPTPPPWIFPPGVVL